MKQELSKSRKLIFMIVMCLSNIAIMGTTFYSVIMTKLYANYAEWAVNLAMALPGIIGLFACLAVGKISDMMNKKWLFIAGLVLFALTGATFALLPSNIGLVVMASFNGGLCYGMVSVSAVGIISDTFSDESVRSKALGIYNGVMALVGAALALLYGFFGDLNWKMAPSPNWFTLVVAVLALLFVPSCPPIKSAAETGEKVKGPKGWAKHLIPLALAFFIVSFAAMSVFTYIDLYVSGNNLGTSSFTGMLSSIQTISSFACCTAFGWVYAKLKTRITIPAYALIAAGIFLMYFVPSKPTAVIGCIMFGMGWGTVYSFWFFRATVVVPENMVGTATGIVTTANSLSYFPMPYVMSALMAFMHTDNFRDLFFIYGGIVAAACVLSIIINIRRKDTETA
ncbi:MAG: MFS transporter [Bilifractor sp.]